MDKHQIKKKEKNLIYFEHIARLLAGRREQTWHCEVPRYYPLASLVLVKVVLMILH